MLQTLERETTCGESSALPGDLYDASPGTHRGFPENGEARFHGGKKDNPHKYLLYRPSLPQLLVFLASGFKELPPNGVMLLYISADGCLPSVPTSLQPLGLRHAEDECDELMRNDMRIRGRVPDTIPNGFVIHGLEFCRWSSG